MSGERDGLADRAALLARLDLLAGAPEAELRGFAAACELRCWRPGQVLARPEGASDHLHLVLSGRIRLFHRAPNGHEVTAALLGPGHLVGACDIGGTVVGVDGLWAEAVDRSLVCTVPAPALAELLARHPITFARLVRALVERVRAVDQRLQRLTVGSVRARLASALLDLVRDGGAADRGGGVRWVGRLPTHRELSHQIGTSRETVTRALREMEQEGLLRRRRGGGVAVDAAKLAAAGSGASGSRRGCSAMRRAGPVASTGTDSRALPAHSHAGGAGAL
jgi:CRP-like cAMP-binding protein